MNRPGGDLPTIYLKPGRLYLAERPVVVKTVLGSCLSVTMFSPRLCIGGICHAIMPTSRGRDNGEDFRYVDTSLMKMLRWLDARGVGRWETETKLFGGASFWDVPERRGGRNVGELNVVKAREILQAEQLSAVVADIGGRSGRKLFYITHTGEVFLERIGKPAGAGMLRAKG